MNKWQKLAFVYIFIGVLLVSNSVIQVREREIVPLTNIRASLSDTDTVFVSDDSFVIGQLEACHIKAVNDENCIKNVEEICSNNQECRAVEIPKCLLYYEEADCQQTHNRATRLFANHSRDAFGNLNASGAIVPVRSIQLSTGTTTPAINDNVCQATVITGNSLDPVNASTTRFNEGNYTVFNTFTATGTQSDINKVCLSNHTSMQYLFASALFPSAVNMINNDQLTVNYSIAFIP